METTTPRQLPLYQDPAAVRRRRLILGLHQSDVADRAKISLAHVSKIENGHRSAGAKVLHRLAEALDCPVEELLAK